MDVDHRRWSDPWYDIDATWHSVLADATSDSDWLNDDCANDVRRTSSCSPRLCTDASLGDEQPRSESSVRLCHKRSSCRHCIGHASCRVDWSECVVRSGKDVCVPMPKLLSCSSKNCWVFDDGDGDDDCGSNAGLERKEDGWLNCCSTRANYPKCEPWILLKQVTLSVNAMWSRDSMANRDVCVSLRFFFRFHYCWFRADRNAFRCSPPWLLTAKNGCCSWPQQQRPRPPQPQLQMARDCFQCDENRSSSSMDWRVVPSEDSSYAYRSMPMVKGMQMNLADEVKRSRLELKGWWVAEVDGRAVERWMEHSLVSIR